MTRFSFMTLPRCWWRDQAPNSMRSLIGVDPSLWIGARAGSLDALIVANNDAGTG